ncbi:MAG: hypothetical protein J6A92_06350 [Lachnospiraceae bacterium]|nr:hypothetical protein [Lachnospiraceae bacterium]
MEELSILTIKKFKDTIERILHVPGNYRGGILEMAVVADSRLQVEEIQNILPQLLKALKQKGQIFQNVRFNYIFWKNQSIETTVCPMMQAMLESFYQPYEKEADEKDFDRLTDHLKLFQARAKIVLVLTNGKPVWQEEEQLKHMQPFLDKKLLVMQIKENAVTMYYRGREI